ncbi:Sensor kinase CusS [Poriferisphaera corsica]|uniref:histidine kinase n=1 Tax=Poriferisphaera corsica TaxID=2528020 RepID=A0A517YX18_9BACT|nr:ATP-binding protein [Poriferisphaera corsica]QDU34769.1 Sensor kinase CusS [Poriferisphaera corsica]
MNHKIRIKSTRIKLLGGYAALLILLLSIFGITLFQLVNRTSYNLIDEELLYDVGNALITFRNQELQSQPPSHTEPLNPNTILDDQYWESNTNPNLLNDRREDNERWWLQYENQAKSQAQPQIPNSSNPKLDKPNLQKLATPPNRTPTPNPWKSETPQQLKKPYLTIWQDLSNDQRIIYRGYSDIFSLPNTATLDTNKIHYRNRDSWREILLFDKDVWVLAGRPLDLKRAEIVIIKNTSIFLGTIILAAGLLGGWWLTGRAIEPINKISNTARTISASNLDQRIDLEKTEDELGQLALVLNQMFDRLKGSFDQQNQFIADASHELRTPLAILVSQIDLALRRDRDTAEYKDALQRCQRSAHRMKQLVDDLLILAAADQNRLKLNPETFDLADAAHFCIEMTTPLAQQNNITLHLNTQPATITADKVKITQVITNLISNAITYNSPNGSVTITITQTARKTTLTVSDTGIGIAPQDVKHIFERFYRVDKARSRQRGGSGLGLGICKSIIDAHQGFIWCESTPNLGSSFSFSI